MKNIIQGAIRVYQYISGGLRLAGGPFVVTTGCKFYPSCSEYALQAVGQHGAMKGSLKAVNRVCRCHPWSVGGVDYP